MLRFGEMGWWGRHPYAYVAIMNGAAVGSVAGLVAASAGGSVGLALIAGLSGLLMSVAAGYSWHWLLVGRHRDGLTNPRRRSRLGRRLSTAGEGVLWLLVAFLALGGCVGLYDSWRLDRYGITATAVVVTAGRTDASAEIITGDGVRRVEVRAEDDDYAGWQVGDRLEVIYDPDPAYGEVVLADRNPYLGWPVGLLFGAVVLVVIMLCPSARPGPAAGSRDSRRPPTTTASMSTARLRRAAVAATPRIPTASAIAGCATRSGTGVLGAAPATAGPTEG